MDPEIDQIEDENQTELKLEASGEEEDVGDQVEGDGDAANDGEDDSDDGEHVITLGGEKAPVEEEDDTRAPAWVRDVRKTNRELVRKTREQEAEIARLKGSGTPTQPAAIVVGEEPKFEDCDYDPDKFKAATLAWAKRKQDAETQETERSSKQKADQQAWEKRIAAVDAEASKLKVRDPEGALMTFEDTFSILQRGIILNGPDDVKTSATLRLALGANPKVAKELAAINDPIKFTLKLGKIIEDMSVTTRKTAPVPERSVRGNVAGGSAVDKTLERLQKDADRSGDRTKVAAYIREQNQRRRAA